MSSEGGAVLFLTSDDSVVEVVPLSYSMLLLKFLFSMLRSLASCSRRALCRPVKAHYPPP
jgi:hypothetical protein